MISSNENLSLKLCTNAQTLRASICPHRLHECSCSAWFFHPELCRCHSNSVICHLLLCHISSTGSSRCLNCRGRQKNRTGKLNKCCQKCNFLKIKRFHLEIRSCTMKNNRKDNASFTYFCELRIIVWVLQFFYLIFPALSII